METLLQNHKLTKTFKKKKNCAKIFKGLHICTCVHKLTLKHLCVLLHNQCPTLLKLHDTWGEVS